jgi:hypothetical protein
VTTWILIFAIFVDRGGGPAVATFYDKAACESAIREIEKARNVKFENDPNGSGSSAFAICIPAKNGEKVSP